MAARDAVKWRNSAEQVQGQATGDAQLVFHPVHQNALTCQRCNGATVIITDKLQRGLQQFAALMHSVLQQGCCRETLCSGAEPPQWRRGIIQGKQSLSSSVARSKTLLAEEENYRSRGNLLKLVFNRDAVLC